MHKAHKVQPDSIGDMRELDQYPHVLRRHRLFDAQSSVEIRDTLVERYGASGFDIMTGDSPVHGIGSLLRLKEIDIGYLYFSEEAKASFQSAGFYRQQFAVAGSSRTKVGTQQFDVDHDSTGVVPFDAAATYHYDAKQAQIVFRVGAATVRRKLGALIGRPVGRDVEFAPSDTFSNPRQLALRRLLNSFVGEIDQDFALSEFTSAEFAQLLIVKFLVANRHNFNAIMEGRVSEVAPRQVHIVEEYLVANWDKPVSIEQLAEHTGVGIRNMFATFKKARGYTPMSFLQMERLKHARSMLENPTQSTSVVGVSLKCGFRHEGRFAKYYRQAFGEPPSVTLANARLR